VCLRLAIRHELRRENAAAARELLGELDAPETALVDAVKAMESRVAARQAELARLEALDADSDLWVGMRARAAMFVLLALLSLAITGYVIWRTGGDASGFGPWDLVRFAGVVCGALALILLVFGRVLLANGIGRRVTAMFVLAMGGLLVHRVIAAEHGVDPASTLTMDLVILGVLGAAAGVVVPRFGWTALPVPIGIVLCLVLDTHVPVVFSVTTLAMITMVMVVGVIELRARRPKETATAPAGSADRRPSRADGKRST
jgi:hypothetical protein